MKEKDELRREKDQKIRDLEDEKEKQRVHYEEIINKLEIELKSNIIPYIIMYQNARLKSWS